MKTLSPHERNALECEILGRIIQRKDLLNSASITEDDFKSGLNKKLFRAIEDTPNVSLAILANDFDIIDIKYLFETSYIPTVFDFMSAYNFLKEDNTRHSINRATEQCGDSLEYLDFIDTLKAIQTPLNMESFDEHIEKYGKEHEEIAERLRSGQSAGLLIGWNKFNEYISLFGGDYAVLGGRTSIGKTTFSLNMAIEAAMMGEKVAFISLEMPRKHIFDKICACLAREEIYKYKYAKKPFENSKAILEQLEGNLDFFYLPACTTVNIRQILSKKKFDLVVVDYLQLLKDKGSNETENLRLGKISGNLKLTAGEFKCVVLVTAQLNRESEKQNREPRLSDLRDSGCIEQDADIVMLLHRENRECIDSKLIIAKNRVGKTGNVEFLFNPEWGYFKENNEIS